MNFEAPKNKDLLAGWLRIGSGKESEVVCDECASTHVEKAKREAGSEDPAVKPLNTQDELRGHEREGLNISCAYCDRSVITEPSEVGEEAA